jgi:hypothetical protein
MLITNAGSRIADSGNGWTNTEASARQEAERWLAAMRGEGLTDIELVDGAMPFENRWRFTYRHTVTGATATLETHGIDDAEAYQAENIFPPRVYWNGSSTAHPQLEDFAADGYEPVQTYRPVIEGQSVDVELVPHRDDRVRAALAAKVPVAQIMRETGLSRSRIYQIRDGRR